MKKTLTQALLLLVLCFTQSLYAQQKKITGKVTSQVSSEPLVGVTVMIKGTSQGAITDETGSFSLNVPEDGVLIVSYLGYEPQEMLSAMQMILPFN